jgi:hypothetical protein
MGITHARQATDGDDFSPSGKEAWNDDHVVSYPLEVAGSTTWADRPDATLHNGKIIRISDVGTAGSLWMSDGTRWYPMNGRVTLAMSGAGLNAPGDTNENPLVTITIPAGIMGVNGTLMIDHLWTLTNNANVKTLRVRFSGASGTTFYSANNASSNGVHTQTWIQNRNAANSQVGGFAGDPIAYRASPTVTPSTAAIDTTAATTVVISAQKGTAGDTVTLDRYQVDLITP